MAIFNSYFDITRGYTGWISSFWGQKGNQLWCFWLESDRNELHVGIHMGRWVGPLGQLGLQNRVSYHWQVGCWPKLLGGWEHVWYFCPFILGIILPTDFHIFQRGRLNHQPELDAQKWSTHDLTQRRQDYTEAGNIMFQVCSVGGWTIGMIPLEVSSWGSSLSEILRQNTGQYPPNIPGQSPVLGAQGVPAPWRLEGARVSRDGRDGRWCGMSGATSEKDKKKLVNHGDGVMFRSIHIMGST